LVQDRGGAEFKTGGIHRYFEDFKRGTNKDIGAKDNFETASSKTKLGRSTTKKNSSRKHETKTPRLK